MKIVIIAGRIKAKNLIGNLKSKTNQIVYINNELKYAEQISKEFNIKTFCGDGTDPQVLKNAEINNFDLLISLCPKDEDSLVICRLAKAMGIKKTLAIVQYPRNIEVFKQLNVDIAISISSLIASLIKENAHTNRLESFLPIDNGKVILLEVIINPDYKIVNKALSEIVLPAECVVSAITRKNETVIPRGKTEILSGDKLIIITLPELKQRVLKAVTASEQI